MRIFACKMNHLGEIVERYKGVNVDQRIVRYDLYKYKTVLCAKMSNVGRAASSAPNPGFVWADCFGRVYVMSTESSVPDQCIFEEAKEPHKIY